MVTSKKMDIITMGIDKDSLCLTYLIAVEREAV